MKNKNCNIYGPDLSTHEDQGKEIAQTALKCMRGVGATDREGAHDGPDTSKNDLERLK